MLAILLVFAANLPPIVQPACGKAHWISLGGQFSSTFCLGQAQWIFIWQEGQRAM